MIVKPGRILISIALALLLGTLLGGAPVGAADCEALKAAALKERNLLKQNNLLAEAVAACPKDAELNYKYGYSMERLRKYDDALKYYKLAVDLNSKVGKYHFGKADIFMLLGDVASAAKSYEKGLKLVPANSRARRSLEEAKAKMKPTAKPRAVAAVKKAPAQQVKAVKTKKAKAAIVGPVSGPTIKVKRPDLTGFGKLVKALEQDVAQSGSDELAVVPGGSSLQAERVRRREALRASAKLDSQPVDPEKIIAGAVK